MPKRTSKAADTLKIRLIKSPIGYSETHKATVRALGLRRMRQVVEQPDSRDIRGMIAKVAHLVEVVRDGDA